MEIRGRPLAYLDNASTTQKPVPVIEAMERFYRYSTANVHRGVHALSDCSSAMFEDARRWVKVFLNAGSEREIVFVRGATEAVNLVAASWGSENLREGSEILVSEMEHHANIVPWQMIARRTGARLCVVSVDDDGELRVDALREMLSERVAILAVTHVSNALGTVNPVKEIVKLAHECGVPVLIDGAQGVPHLKVDVRDLDADFYVFSGHKVFAPSGIGVLYGKEKLLEAMPPYQTGGDMILTVSFERTTFNDLPHKFEAGTPNIEGAIGLAEALKFLGGLDRDAAMAHERALLAETIRQLDEIDGLRRIGRPKHQAGSISFTVPGVHPHDMGALLDSRAVAVRAGHHCAQPLMERFGVGATTRASFAFYNTFEEVERLVRGIRTAREYMK